MLDLRGPERFLDITWPDGTKGRINVVPVSHGTMMKIEAAQEEARRLQKKAENAAKKGLSEDAAAEELGKLRMEILRLSREIILTVAPTIELEKIPIERTQDVSSALMQLAARDMRDEVEKKTSPRRRGRKRSSSKAATA